MTSNTQVNDDPESKLKVLAAVFTITLTVGLFVLQLFSFPVDESILDTQVQIFDLESTYSQVSLYITLLGLLAALCTSMLVLPNVKTVFMTGGGEYIIVGTTVCAAVVLGSWSIHFLLGFVLATTLVITSRTKSFQLISSGWSRLTVVQSQQFVEVFYWLFIFIAFVYVVLFMVIPLTTPLIVNGPEDMRSIEGHYAMTVLPGFDLICCSEIGTIERANYGLGIPLLTAVTLKMMSIFETLDTSLVQVVKINQISAAVLICVLSYLTNKKISPLVVVLTLGMTAFTLSNVGVGVPYPNQSGIRYIPLLCSLIILVIELRREQFRLWVLASVAPIIVIMSPETGLAATAGYTVASVLMRHSPKRPVVRIAVTLMWFLGVFLAMGVAVSILVIEPILKTSSGGLFQFLSLFTVGGYGGLVSKPSMMAMLLFFVATNLVLRGVWRARMRVLSPLDALEAATGTIMLVWLMYYVNRMAEWNLWFQLVLLMIMIAPRIIPEVWQRLCGKSLGVGLTYSMVVAGLIGGQLTFSAAHFANQITDWSNSQPQCVDGVGAGDKCLLWIRGTKFEMQMNALIEGYLPAEALVLTGVSTYVRLNGFNEGFPWYDSMEVVNEDEIELVVNWLELRGPQYILADDPNYDIALAAPLRNTQIQSYLKLLDSYQEVGRQAGWIILERVPGQNNALEHKVGLISNPADPS